MTKLSAKDEAGFQAWTKKHRLKESDDYDLRGAYKAGKQPDKRGHMDDQYKLPNHITFSEDSIYHGKKGAVGGKWTQRKDGKWDFQASTTNLQHYTPRQMQQYFRKYEPDSTVQFPSRVRPQRSR